MIIRVLDRVVGTAITTDGATWVTLITYTPYENSVSYAKAQMVGKDPSNNGAVFHLNFAFTRTTGAPALIGGVGSADNFLSAALSTADKQAVISGNNILIQVKGVTAITIEWMADMEIQVV